MKANIKIVTANKEFNHDQKEIIRRMCIVLGEHDLSVCVFTKVKKEKENICPVWAVKRNVS